MTLSGTVNDNEWYNESQRVTTSGTASDNEWQQVTMSNKKWQWVTASDKTNECEWE